MSRYSNWFPLTEEGLEESGLSGPAALQVRRAQGVVDYGEFKSAMVWYGYASEDGAATLRKVFAEELNHAGERGQRYATTSTSTRGRPAARAERAPGSPPVRRSHQTVGGRWT